MLAVLFRIISFVMVISQRLACRVGPSMVLQHPRRLFRAPWKYLAPAPLVFDDRLRRQILRPRDVESPVQDRNSGRYMSFTFWAVRVGGSSIGRATERPAI